jgi:cell division septation protein DedD
MSLDRDHPARGQPGNDRPAHLGAPGPRRPFAPTWVALALIGIVLVAAGVLVWAPAPSAMLASPSGPAMQTRDAPEAASPPAIAAGATPGTGTAAAATVGAATASVVRSGGEITARSRGETVARSRGETVAQLRGDKKEEAGAYWVQVGAFRDPRMAAALAEKLRAEKFRVQESTVARGRSESPGRDRDDVRGAASTGGAEGGERYEVFVSGLSPADLLAKVASRGLSASAAAGGAVVRPGLALRDAVALSKDLTSHGLMVQVRRVAGGPADDRRAPTPEGAGSGETIHRVRVGSFPDRATAEEARRELSIRGYAGFLTREGG